MRLFRTLATAVLFMAIASCNAQPVATENPVNNSDKIEAYYFHFTARCVTCNTIEARAKENLETLYPNQFKNGLITFQSVNLEDPESRPLAKRLGVNGQSLLIVRGDQKINLTNEGFMYATVKPERFREIINEKVDGLLIK